MTRTTGHLHLGVSLDGAGSHPAAWQEPDSDAGHLFDASRIVDLALIAERGTLDFVTLDDSFALQSPGTDRVRGRLDALLALARVAPLTNGIGLVPTVTTTHTEPFHISKNVATLDLVSAGRGGWRAQVSSTEVEATHFGRKPVATDSDLHAEAAEVIEVVRRLWDSWDDDAVIRDQATGRYIDRDRLHYVDFVGRFFKVRGPSITPRSPQAQPLVAIDADSDASIAVASSLADIAVIQALDAESARARRLELRRRAGDAGRDEDALFVLGTVDALFADGTASAAAQRARLDAIDTEPPARSTLDFVGTASDFAMLAEDWFRSGAVDGFIVRPARLPRDLLHLVDGVVPVLRERGVFRSFYGGNTLRDHFGLVRPANRFAAAR